MDNYELDSNSEQVAALIVTYNPDVELLKKNIKATSANVGDNYLIVDNGSKNLIEILNAVGKEHVLNLNSNKGIAAAQNAGFRRLQTQSYDWVLLLDQDSVIPLDLVSRMEAMPQFSLSDTGIIAAAFDNHSYVNQGIIEKKNVIASGGLIKVNAWSESGGMDDDLFIDFVDFDFDARVLAAGYKIYQNTDIVMQHEIGDTIYAPIRGHLLHLGAYHGYFSDHSPMRIYYFYKNFIIVHRRYPDYFDERKGLFRLSVSRLREIFLYRRPRGKKFLAAFKGIKDGIRYNPKKDTRFQGMMRKVNEKN
ncbi:glycosyltransferase [Lactiplantibacillus pentosus]|uniref:Glycosyltransferase n=1 Tax=Lactiplantibacillus pentosus TaxID=1589 RepID=A0AAW8VZR8_LACPE|nr:glycosyltransferase [Lactiplantibacillus pentosus]MBU7474990.1 glycosyltransferase [Lactiplantibacillus pentosus]MBU7530287.1 glycosyltransferase [Lactiplantibacillus pentosus]MCE6030993.1 glycosyltransferase [Lactiplantibacillus pentosus]MDT6990961.1 glycosyltransferase [Lactiplantibacillus pentosus]